MNNTMISLTENAKMHIQKMMEKQPNSLGFRLAVKQTGCTGYMYLPEIVKEAKPEDIQLQVNEILIFIDKNAAEMIKGTEIDYIHKNLGMSQLVFNNPNAKSLCGCGESFNLRDNHE